MARELRRAACAGLAGELLHRHRLLATITIPVLASADFFEVEAHPQITFVSTEVERADETTWLVTGDLTIKGTTKPVTIEFEQTGSARDPFGNLRVGFEGSTAINRKDWGLTWNAALETGGVLVSERVKLDFDISAIQSA